MDTDRILDFNGFSVVSDVVSGLLISTIKSCACGIMMGSYQIMDCSKTITAQAELQSLRPKAVLSTIPLVRRVMTNFDERSVHIEGKLARMRMFRSRIWDDHLSQGDTIGNRSHFAVVVIRDSGKRNAFSMGEAYTRVS